MAFGNGLGVKIEHSVDKRDLFEEGFGCIVAEVPAEKVGELAVTYTLVGEVLAEPVLCYSDMKLTLADAEMAWKSTLEKVFKTVSGEGTKGEEYPDTCYQAEKVYVCKNKIARPRVFIPVFPGTNCEYDSTKAFERAGADEMSRYSKT